MVAKSYSRRGFIKKNSLTGMGIMLSSTVTFPAIAFAGKSDMDDIATAIDKIQKNIAKLKNSN